jgi:hypothetical protein
VPEPVTSGKAPSLGVGKVNEEVPKRGRRHPMLAEQRVCERAELFSEHRTNGRVTLRARELLSWTPTHLPVRYAPVR